MMRLYIAALLISFASMMSLFASKSRADESWPEWNDEVRLDFAKCLYAEDSSGTDWSALGWALVKQWRLKHRRLIGIDYTFHKQVRWYCAVFEKLGPKWLGKRPHLIRTATWDLPPSAKAARKWRELKLFVFEFESRFVRDPCPACIWWGGPKCDVIPKNWICPLKPPNTKNAFCHRIGSPGR